MPLRMRMRVPPSMREGRVPSRHDARVHLDRGGGTLDLGALGGAMSTSPTPTASERHPPHPMGTGVGADLISMRSSATSSTSKSYALGFGTYLPQGGSDLAAGLRNSARDAALPT